METTENRKVAKLIQALNRQFDSDFYAKFITENSGYYEFVIIKRGGNSYFYVRYHKLAEYFCDVFNLFMAGVNPIDAERFQKATEYARKQLDEQDY